MNDENGTGASAPSYKNAVTPPQTPPISVQFAEREFDRFMECMDLSADTTLMVDAEEVKDFTKNKARFINAVRRGYLTVDDEGVPTYTCQKDSVHGASKPVFTFQEPTGAALLDMDKSRDGADVSKLYTAMGAMTGHAPKVFSGLHNRDLKVLISISTLFLA